MIATAGPIPNDGVALRKGFPDDVGKQVKDALLAYSKDAAGAKVLSQLFAWDGVQEVTASFYDAIKEAAALAGVDVEGLAKNTPRPAATPAPSKTP